MILYLQFKQNDIKFIHKLRQKILRSCFAYNMKQELYPQQTYKKCNLISSCEKICTN
jgi:hypothetical protein